MDANIKLGHSQNAPLREATCNCGVVFMATKCVKYCDECRKLHKDRRPKYLSVDRIFPHPYWWGVSRMEVSRPYQSDYTWERSTKHKSS